MSTNLTQGIMQVVDNSVWSINDALRQITQRLDDLKGLSGQVTINDRVAVSNPVVVADAVNLGSLNSTLTGYVPTSRLINTTSPLSGGGNLSADRTLSLGTVPIANGGTNATSFTTASIPYFDGTKLNENNANLFWTNATTLLTATNMKSTGRVAFGATGVLGGSLGPVLNISETFHVSSSVWHQIDATFDSTWISSGVKALAVEFTDITTDSSSGTISPSVIFGRYSWNSPVDALGGITVFNMAVRSLAGGTGLLQGFTLFNCMPGVYSGAVPSRITGFNLSNQGKAGSAIDIMLYDVKQQLGTGTFIGFNIIGMASTMASAVGMIFAAQNAAVPSLSIDSHEDLGISVSKKLLLECVSVTSKGTTYLWANGAGKPELYATGVKVWDATTTQWTCDVNFGIADGKNCVLGTTTGTIWGSTVTQKQSWWGAPPIVQPTTAIAASTFVANTSGIVNDTATWDGYTIGQVVKALRNEGLLA